MIDIKQINFVTVALIAAFVLPILAGVFEPFSRWKVKHSLGSLFDRIEFLFGIFMAVYLTKKIFFEHDSGFFKQVYNWIPLSVTAALRGKDVLTYIVAGPVIFLIVLLVLRIITTPLYRYMVDPLSDGLCSFIERRSIGFKRFFGALWQLPRSIYIVFILGLLLNFYSYYFSNPALSKWMNESAPYQNLYKHAIYPVLNSNIAKKIPVIVNDSFSDTFGRVLPGDADTGEPVKRKGIRIIQYFNGVTLDEAIQSTPQIDAAAKKIVGNEQNSAKKAALIYKWVSRNVKYDYEKAERISRDSTGVSSGSKVAFETKKGICFDYSCLYISMCRAVGVKVRLITGLAYSGVSWGDHAWNQAYSQEDGRWINVDATFGAAANYFDKPDFGVDHKYAVIQGEW